MTRINWDEVHQLTRLDEIIAYCIITLEEAYTAPNNEDLDIATKEDVSGWVRWAIGYDDSGRAYFRYSASLYLVDKTPMSNVSMLDLINSPNKWLVNHASVSISARTGDTSLKIDPLTNIPAGVTTMEKLLWWAIVVGNWWNLTLKYLGATEIPEIPTETPIDDFEEVVSSPGDETTDAEDDASTIEAQFDDYNGDTTDDSIPEYLTTILEFPSEGTGDFTQSIDLSATDSGSYRESLTTCEEQDSAIKTYSQQSLEILLPTK
jgi:hypothetical protein